MERNGHVGFQLMALVDPQRIISGVCFAFCIIIIILLIAQHQYSHTHVHTPNGMFGGNVYFWIKLVLSNDKSNITSTLFTKKKNVHYGYNFDWDAVAWIT